MIGSIDVAKSSMIKTVLAGLLVMAVGCVEQSAAGPNSDLGYLFIDLEGPVAVGWTSEVIIMGPATGGSHCADGVCYADHRRLEMEEVRSTDAEILEVIDFEEVLFGEVAGVRVELQAHTVGTVGLEFEFSIDGDDGEELLLDTYSVETREVAFHRLSRILDHISPQGPYGRCPERGAGTYLMDFPGEYQVQLRYLKIDDRGEALRGSGQFPFDIEPEGIVEVDDVDESQHLIRLKVEDFGSVTIAPEEAGDVFTAHFRPISDVQQMRAQAYELSGQGQRGLQVNSFVEGYYYEVEIAPQFEGAPLCGGRMEVQFLSLTPGICEIAAISEGQTSAAIAAHFVGQCHLRLIAPAAAGGQGLVEDLVVSVGHAW